MKKKQHQRWSHTKEKLQLNLVPALRDRAEERRQGEQVADEDERSDRRDVLRLFVVRALVAAAAKRRGIQQEGIIKV